MHFWQLALLQRVAPAARFAGCGGRAPERPWSHAKVLVLYRECNNFDWCILLVLSGAVVWSSAPELQAWAACADSWSAVVAACALCVRGGG